MITIVGAGPGTREYMTPEAASAIASSRVIIGGARVLDAVDLPREARRVELPASGMAGAVAEALQRESGGDVTLLVSGDPGFYSLAKRVTSTYGRERVRIVPGISSIQLMSARICRSWAGASSVTMHGRSDLPVGELASRLRASSALVVLFGVPEDVEPQMKRLAADEELGNAWAALGWDLGLPDERIFEANSLRELAPDPYRGRLSLLWLERI
ncbi:MAG: precorrin-6y C5,15-methyltransferase (decarboxylating) subunit CbiE [Synergistaceae bacterium]|jgi:precorrin-6y C5,15-methyltransferase (decarboxylating) CbiE subunit|nr:precorrin-6y C5,15-methyltransferase (decarboxylating) subunit CbiE [Synergistaceae bacterium]